MARFGRDEKVCSRYAPEEEEEEEEVSAGLKLCNSSRR